MLGNISDIISAISGLASAANSLGVFSQGGNGGGSLPPLPGQSPEPTRGVRPNLGPAPSRLGFGSGLTEQQQRAQIATMGTQGSDSAYRDTEATDFYKELLKRALIKPSGDFESLDNLLPVEDQYLKQTLGYSYDPRTSALMKAIFGDQFGEFDAPAEATGRRENDGNDYDGQDPNDPGFQDDLGYTDEELGMTGIMSNARTRDLGWLETLATQAIGTAVPAAGMAMKAVNTAANINNTLVNAPKLAEIGVPITEWEQIKGFLGLNGYSGNLTDTLNAAMQTQRGRDALSVGKPSTQEINDEIAGSQSGFTYDRPAKYSIETQTLDDGTGGYGGLDTAYGSKSGVDTGDAFSDQAGGLGDNGAGDLSGPDSGDPDDEAAGESDMGSDQYREGGLVGDDDDDKFEPVRATLHENEAVLKPEAVALLGEDLVEQLNNVAALKPDQKRKLVKQLTAQIMRRKPGVSRSDFQASR